MPKTESKLHPSAQDHLAELPELLAKAGAAVLEDGIMDPAELEREAEMEEEQRLSDERSGKNDIYEQRIRALEERLAQYATRLEDAEKLAKNAGLDHEFQDFQVRLFQEDAWFKQEFQRIRDHQNGLAVVVIGPDPDAPASLRPVKGSINLHRFVIERGKPTLVNIAILERLRAARVLAVERYVDREGQRKSRFVNKFRAPFSLLPATANAQAKAMPQLN